MEKLFIRLKAEIDSCSPDQREPVKESPSKDQPEPEKLPMIMEQHFEILHCILAIISVAGDLSILESHAGEMSTELFEEMKHLTELLKKFDKDFCFEY